MVTGCALLMAIFTTCMKDEGIIRGEFEFTADYKTSVVVGGFVGITERTFKKGEIYKGVDDGGKIITIRIAEHSDLNDDCPNSWCYQELLEVPREFLKFRE